MPRFAVGDEVIVNNTDDNENHWAFYLAGSKGIIDKVHTNHHYHCEFIEVVDAQPKIRERHHYSMEFLTREHSFDGDDLDPSPEPLVKPCDDGFETVF